MIVLEEGSGVTEKGQKKSSVQSNDVNMRKLQLIF